MKLWLNQSRIKIHVVQISLFILLAFIISTNINHIEARSPDEPCSYHNPPVSIRNPNTGECEPVKKVKPTTILPKTPIIPSGPTPPTIPPKPTVTLQENRESMFAGILIGGIIGTIIIIVAISNSFQKNSSSRKNLGIWRTAKNIVRLEWRIVKNIVGMMREYYHKKSIKSRAQKAEEERKKEVERDRMEREKERLEKERLEEERKKEVERDRIEREKERLEKERLEEERKKEVERDRMEREKELHKLRISRYEKILENDKKRYDTFLQNYRELERDRIEREKERLEKERLEEERKKEVKRDRIEREKERLEKERRKKLEQGERSYPPCIRCGHPVFGEICRNCGKLMRT